jgi:hypothetical protein
MRPGQIEDGLLLASLRIDVFVQGSFLVAEAKIGPAQVKKRYHNWAVIV